MAVFPSRQISLPKRVTFVEYIQGSGTQYIDTGFKPNNNTRVVLDAQATEANKFFFGARNSGSTNSFSFCETSATQIRSDFGSAMISQTVTDSLIRATADKNKATCTWGGYTISNEAATFQCDYNLFLLACNTAGSPSAIMPGKIYSCKIYDNGTLVRDYWPCIDPDGVACLYDKVSGEYAYNAGTGTFTAG